MNNNKYKKFLIILLFQIFSFNLAFSEIIKEFNVVGNDRVSDETVIMFSNLNIGQNVDMNTLNASLKELYNTNYFKDVRIKIDDGIIVIKIVENPIIQSVQINGIEEDNIYQNIKEITSKIEKYPFVKSKINEQVILLKTF